MIASSIFLGICGIVLTFFPKEILGYLNTDSNQILVLILQILGSLYLGNGILNWMTKHNLMGGIYSRPLVIGNLIHFLVSFFAIIKVAFSIKNHFEVIFSLMVIYFIFTVCFGFIFMKSPNMSKL